MVSRSVEEAARTASAALRRAGVRHSLIGGLAVGAHGHPRATRDVDFVVGPEAFLRHEGGLVTLRPEVPYSVGGVAVDLVSGDAGEAHIERALAHAQESAGIPVAPVESVVHLKLLAGRMQDQADIVELVKAGADERSIRSYLSEAAPSLVPEFNRLAERARTEPP